VIPLGIDLTQFSPLPQAQSRQVLQLPREGILVAAVAASWDNPHKGGALLLEVVRGLKEADMRGEKLGQVVLAGRMEESTRRSFLEAGAIVLDGMQGSDTIRHVFSACDASLMLSGQENLPFVVIESMGCGCPPIGRAIGGVPEMFIDSQSGWLLPVAAQATDVLARIRALGDRSPCQRAQIRQAARAHAERVFGLDTMLDAYEGVYRSLLSTSPKEGLIGTFERTRVAA
jgi:glycosyltransferase involved in cell wall biosynthesis